MCVIVHFITPKYVRDTVNDMECEKEDRQIIQRLDPSVEWAGLSHYDLHQKREEVVKRYYQQIKDKEEQERIIRNHSRNLQIVKRVLDL